jgi:hypothetical protein
MLEAERLGGRPELQVRVAVEVRAEVLQVGPDVQKPEPHRQRA